MTLMLTIPKGAWATCGFTTPPVISRYCQRTRNFTPPGHFGKIKQTHTELVFLHLLVPFTLVVLP